MDSEHERALELIADFPVRDDATAITAKMLQQVAAKALGRKTVSQEAFALAEAAMPEVEAARASGETFRPLSEFLRELRANVLSPSIRNQLIRLSVDTELSQRDRALIRVILGDFTLEAVLTDYRKEKVE